MKLLMLCPKGISQSSKMIHEEAKKLFKEVDIVPIKEVVINTDGPSATYNGKELIDYNYLLPRIDSKRANFGYHVIKFFDKIGTPKPYNAETILVAHNKFSTLFELRKHGLPVPQTFYTASQKSAEELIKKMKFPGIIKLVSSFGGQGVMFLESKQAAMSVVKTLDELKQDILLEEFIEGAGEDIRGFLIGDEIIGMKRIAKKGETRANVKAGGKAVTYKLDDEEEEMTRKAAKILGAKICAIDMMESKSGPQIIEANINPGLLGIQKATGENLAQKIAKFCYEEAKK